MVYSPRVRADRVVAVPVDGVIYLIAYGFIAEGPKGFVARAQSEMRDYVAWRDDGWLEVYWSTIEAENGLHDSQNGLEGELEHL